MSGAEIALNEAGEEALGSPAEAAGRADAMPSFRLDGRVAIVTGASSGLGAGLARTLGSAGARVAVVARRYERLAELAGEIDGLAVACDLSDLERVGEVVPKVVAELGAPTILVNAAGNIFTSERAENEPLDAMRRTL